MSFAAPTCALIAPMGPLRTDETGCILPSDHEGPHRCTDNHGNSWEWETDWSCECDNSCDGDWCILMWEVEPQNASRNDFTPREKWPVRS